MVLAWQQANSRTHPAETRRITQCGTAPEDQSIYLQL
jgi:hypothetical protein